MRNKTSTWIFFFLFVLTASGVFAAMVENSRQGLPAISVTSHPAFSLESSEQRQGLSRVLLELVSGGAFISKDPIGFAGGHNLFAYVANRPIIATDPFGNVLVIDDIALLAQISALTGLTVAYLKSPAGQAVLNSLGSSIAEIIAKIKQIGKELKDQLTGNPDPGDECYKAFRGEVLDWWKNYAAVTGTCEKPGKGGKAWFEDALRKMKKNLSKCLAGFDIKSIDENRVLEILSDVEKSGLQW